MTKISVTYEFDCPEERELLNRLMNSSKYYDMLYELDRKLRETIKYGQFEWLTDDVCSFLQDLRDDMWESVLNEY